MSLSSIKPLLGQGHVASRISQQPLAALAAAHQQQPASRSAGARPPAQPPTPAPNTSTSRRGGSPTSSGGAAPLQPKPAVRQQQLPLPVQPDSAARKSRRWHKDPDAAARGAQADAAHHHHNSHSISGTPAAPSRAGASHAHQPRAAWRRSGARAHDAEDDSDEGEDDEGAEEFAGLSPVEIERMVFASAKAAATSSSADVDVPSLRAPRAAPREVAPAAPAMRSKAAPAAPTAPAASAAAPLSLPAVGLSSALQARITAAAAAGKLRKDALYEQIDRLLQAAARVPLPAPAPPHGGRQQRSAATVTTPVARPAPSSGGSQGHQQQALAGMEAVARVLACGDEEATAMVVRMPQYVSIELGELEQRLHDLASRLGMDMAAAQKLAVSNPALLLVRHEVLQRKLQALSNATGLPPAQAAAMVTPYMFK